MAVSLNIQSHEAGTVPGAGSFVCLECSTPLVLTSSDELPECSSCGGSVFRRASLFEHASPADHPTAEASIIANQDFGEWLEEIRAGLDGSGNFLAFHGDDGVRVLTLADGWTRIGRSAVADIRLDDPTVSRRHALLILQEGAVRVLDDRSMNGVFVNDEQVEWRTLKDGDELGVGRYRLHFIQN
jgi:DNA-directed RNA polymerase subunit RPC12/RpoP